MLIIEEKYSGCCSDQPLGGTAEQGNTEYSLSSLPCKINLNYCKIPFHS